MKINIVCVGKLSSEFVTLFEHYKKRINIYSDLNVIEVKEHSEETNDNIKKQKETDEILKKIPSNAKAIYCSLQGKQLSSEEFSNFFNEDNLYFVIGGSNGVIEEKFANKINFSKMTFPHQLFRVMLMEQIYRGLAIKHNSKYHK